MSTSAVPLRACICFLSQQPNATEWNFKKFYSVPKEIQSLVIILLLHVVSLPKTLILAEIFIVKNIPIHIVYTYEFWLSFQILIEVIQLLYCIVSWKTDIKMFYLHPPSSWSNSTVRTTVWLHITYIRIWSLAFHKIMWVHFKATLWLRLRFEGTLSKCRHFTWNAYYSSSLIWKY